MIVPLATSGKVVGAIEIASVKTLTPAQKDLLEKMAEPIAASLFSVRANLITTQLLDESRKQAEELLYQEQELRKINDELTQKSDLLQHSEEVLRSQQEEMKQVNIQLEDKAKLLEEQNLAIEEARQSLSFKAEQLEQSNKYKSAFLANMSHELRTPLNSILILAKILEDNKHHTLDVKQVEHARIIHKSGSDLLTLINDILDLSKIEAGKVELQLEYFPTKLLAEDMQMLFREFAIEKQIDFIIDASDIMQSTIYSDKVRVEQVVKNLLSNAMKFTPAKGTVELKMGYADKEIVFKNKTLLQSDRVISIAVRDTGIGISEDKQKLVFEAFQQADGSTSRKYGGTGLGLAISRELANMLGGELTLESIEGVGSTFRIYLPEDAQEMVEEESAKNEITTEQNTLYEQKTELFTPPINNNITHQNNTIETVPQYSNDEIKDDRNNIIEQDKVVLIIEDDFVFARALMSHCHRHGLKSIIALQGEQGLRYADEYRPDSILLDMRMPVMDGWTVLKKLKENKQLQNIPVHVISSMDVNNMGLEMGAFSYLKKPAGKEEMDHLFQIISANLNKQNYRMLLLATHNDEVAAIVKLIKEREKNIEIDFTEDVESCMQQAQHTHYDCLLVHRSPSLNLSEEKLQILKTEEMLVNVPMLFYADNPDECLREVNEVLQLQLPKQSDNQTKLFLNNRDSKTIAGKDISDRLSTLLNGKTVLLADDDMRNIYSMTSVLESEGLHVICAMDGRDAIEKLKANPQIEIVLMDIMMPEMNGYEAMTAIRQEVCYKKLPMIAVTAKAMTGDREKCMEAGATDYITKPIDAEQLLSLMKVLLY